MKQVLAAARYADIELTSTQLAQMKRYADWLRTEGHQAGGIGPDELDRVERRHLADSLLFVSELDGPQETWDLGTGVGLPGVPMAIALPDTHFVLVDRSGRRIDLLRRALRILELENCEVMQSEIGDLRGEIESIVARASLRPDEMVDVAHRLLVPGGRAVIAGSWRQRPQHPGWTTVEIPQDVLDQTVWLLIMRRE
ncbi:MAG TPA: RsmG family class I SAM-dependent methyltransferase [Acidimicrobiia bacterium]